MPLTAEEKAANRFDQMYARSKVYRVTTLVNSRREPAGIASIFQEMIRAEAGAFVGEVFFVRDGVYQSRHSELGLCTCVTCGAVRKWRGTNDLDAGHFLGGRSASILFEETNVHPQCSMKCNKHAKDDVPYRTYMINRYGPEEIERLEILKARPAERPCTEQWREHYIRKKIEYMDRTKAAKKAMGQ